MITEHQYQIGPAETLYAAPETLLQGDFVYYVVRSLDMGRFTIRGFRVRSDGKTTEPRHVYGPTPTLEGVRAFFAGRRHNMGGGSTIPRQFCKQD